MKKRKPNRGRSGNPAKQRPQSRASVAMVATAPKNAANQVQSKLPLIGLSKLWVQVAVEPVTRVKSALSAPRATAVSWDDRQALALMLAPFLIVAASLASQQLLRTAPLQVSERPGMTVTVAPIPTPTAMPSAQPAFSGIDLGIPAGVAPAERTTVTLRRAPPASTIELPRIASFERPVAPEVRPMTAPSAAPMPPIELPELALLPIPSPASMSVPIPPFELPELALLPRSILQPQPASVTAMPIKPTSRPLEVCVAPPTLFDAKIVERAPQPSNAHEFGLALAAAARAQANEVTIYNAKYQRIAYPMGDVSKLYGVCTDVIVRAYRELGVDLQELIATTRSGRGDLHIDHRRVEVVRQFLAKHGTSLPITDFAEDYRPGDVVTYYRPQNRTTTSHIAIVTDQLAPSGRYLIAHNRGWGTQLEDALFVDTITGHYRFSRLAKSAPAVHAAGNAKPVLTQVATGERNRTSDGRATARR